jgi:hypothetical protein
MMNYHDSHTYLILREKKALLAPKGIFGADDNILREKRRQLSGKTRRIANPNANIPSSVTPGMKPLAVLNEPRKLASPTPTEKHPVAPTLPKKESILPIAVFLLLAVVIGFFLFSDSSGSSSISQTTRATQAQIVYGYVITQDKGSRVYLRPRPKRRGGQPMLYGGYKVEVLSKTKVNEETWYYVNYNGKKGYVFSKYLRIP